MVNNNTLPSIKTVKERLRIKKPWDSIIIFVLNVLIAIPLFIIVHQNLLDPEWPFNFDRVLIFLGIIAVIQLLLQLMRRIIIISIFFYLMFLIYGTVFGNYGFGAVFEDYRSMMYSMADDPYPQDLIISKLLPFPNKSKVINAINFENPSVRNFAIMATTKRFRHVKGFREYRQIIQCFAVFEEINSQWNYVNDPKGREYIAKASETVNSLSGDCDDHAIFMAACVRAIGGTPRLIHTKGHIYPEILIGNKTDLEAVNYLIKKELFVEQSKNKEIHYHIDERGQIWLNLDYTAKYPGGPFMSEEILGALTLQ